jgi:hypothetical protein
LLVLGAFDTLISCLNPASNLSSQGDADMNSEVVDEILEELSSTMERVETQSAAVLEFMRDKGIAKDDELAPYVERAAAASSVRWRATRVRLAHLFAGLEKSERQAKEKEEKAKEQTDVKERQEAHKSTETESSKQPESTEGKRQSATPEDGKNRDASRRSGAGPSAQQLNQKGGAPGTPQGTDAARADHSQSRTEQAHDVTAGPNTHEKEAKPPNKSDKHENAA